MDSVTIANETILYKHYPSDNSKIAILAHPYAYLGGSVDDPCIVIMAEKLQEKGYSVFILDFGSLPSTWFSGRRDAKLFSIFTHHIVEAHSPSHVLVGGYSYGGRIAMHPSIWKGLNLESINIYYIFLAPYLGLGSGLLTGYWNVKAEEFPQNSSILYIAPVNDEFTSLKTFHSFFSKLKTHCSESTMVEMQDCSHILNSKKQKELSHILDEWIK
ncbi:protein disulfide isomerase [Schizosaccharomyces cryophilus OY26]|uniref:Protein disulfide isomerase n=1 Tax=Schizosaccharomyces cryophilus (strain OY26 / ATCC MYA-4695 / CBS 11777 / NBRC 106824 / NRRL Y48691) TaxID=653667 RepID=S9W223_SCHCR|nr:protein disulfide isomerase [Schizosaccharomyces cryophilus OY26]EPY52080.1 protein disulfide isomerase [Schizosaccharomyces cryophilus OY26]